MSKRNKNTELSKLPVAELEVKNILEITKDDIIAIQVSDYEGKLNKTKIALQKDIKVNSQEKDKLSKKMKEDLENYANKKAETKVKDAISALVKLYGSKMSIVSIVNIDIAEPDSKTLSFNVSIIVSQPKIKGSREFETANLKFYYVDRVPALILKDNEKCEELYKTINDLDQQLYDVNKALGSIEVVERQARAHVARKVLSTSPSGKALLKSLNEIEGVPGIKLLT